MESVVTPPAMSPELTDKHRQFDEWVAAVRDPSEKAAEGWRVLRTRNRKGVARYQTAPLPDGRWGLHTDCEYPGFAGSSSCWQAFATREECVSEFLKAAQRFFDRVPDGCASDSHREAQTEMLELLGADSLFGFVEPGPSTEPDDVIEDDVSDDEE